MVFTGREELGATHQCPMVAKGAGVHGGLQEPDVDVRRKNRKIRRRRPGRRCLVFAGLFNSTCENFEVEAELSLLKIDLSSGMIEPPWKGFRYDEDCQMDRIRNHHRIRRDAVLSTRSDKSARGRDPHHLCPALSAG